MKLKLLLLSAALALPTTLTIAQAQDTVSAAPVFPVSVPALPPVHSGPATPAEPASPAEPAAPATPDVPATDAPVTAPAPAPSVLRLTAQPGTYAEYATVLQIKFQLTDMHFEAQPGKTVKAADLAALNAKAKAQSADMTATLNKSGLSQTGKSFVRVQPPVNGNSVILTTTILSLPDALHPGKTRPVSVGITLTSDPSGKVVGAAVTSSDPQLQKIYQAVDVNTLIQNAQQQGGGSLYGQPLVVGRSMTRDSTLDAQRLLQSLLGTAGAAMQNVQVQSKPLVVHGVTTYVGNDASGRQMFTRTLSAEPWNVAVNVNGTKMQMAVTAITGGGTSVVRPDGLNQSENANQTMSMQLQLDMPGEPYRMVMKVQYTVSTSTTLKKITLP
ncbi:hypothetical protein [Deinococcus altitudinis]|uniref:hypothetical protein n=1 Tax=Deinococcus altitudinis TaxID=468914 RepID=UPI00389155EA